MEDYEEYAKHARLITELYALPKERFIQPLPYSPAVNLKNKREIYWIRKNQKQWIFPLKIPKMIAL